MKNSEAPGAPNRSNPKKATRIPSTKTSHHGRVSPLLPADILTLHLPFVYAESPLWALYSNAVQLNGLVILIALLIGGQLLGIPGALLAIPVAEIIRIVVTELLAYRHTTQEANEPAVPSPSQPTASG